MESEKLQRALCNAFCRDIRVNAVPCGLAISTTFTDSSGDRIALYLVQEADGYHLEDDGEYLASLLARDMPIDDGIRAQLLDKVLAQSGAFWDRDTYEIRTTSFSKNEVDQRILEFLSSLIRIRDLEFLSRENVKSTFKEDFIRELDTRAANRSIKIEENVAINKEFSEFPSDLVIRDEKRGKAASVYLVNSNDKLNEALLAWIEREKKSRSDFTVFGVIENSDMTGISRRKFQRAQNRGLPMSIFRGDEDTAVSKVLKELD